MKHKYTESETDWSEDMPVAGNKGRKKIKPSVSIPVGPEQLKGYSLGDECIVTLRGTVKSLESNKHNSRIELLLDESEIESTKTSKAIDELLD